VEKKAAQELIDWQARQALLVLMGRVPPAEGDHPVGQPDEAMIGDSNAMGVGAEIVKDMLGPAKRPLGIDHPIGAEQGAN